MNILIINGSPRQNGNSRIMGKAFSDGAKEAGHKVKIIDAARLEVGACKACDYCLEKEEGCIQNDDMQRVYPFFEEAEMVVFAFPLYFFGMPAQLKVMIDRLYCYEPESRLSCSRNKKCVLLACAGSKDPSDFNALLSHYYTILKHMQWTDDGAVYVNDVFAVGDILKSDWVEQIRELGRSIK